MTTTVIVLTIIISVLKLLVSCLPNDAVAWITRKFELHSKLNESETIVSLNGIELEGETKTQIVNHFNDSLFLKQSHIFPGNEALFLNPEDKGTPYIIDTKKGKHDVRLYMYYENDEANIVKQYKKKLFAYSLRIRETA